MQITVVTYNIQYGTGQDGRYDLDRIAQAVRNGDIICLQEVTTAWPVCNSDDQAGLLEGLLNRYAVYAPAYEVDASTVSSDGTITNARRGFGNMVLSHWPIVYSRPHSLPRPQTEVAAEFHPRVDFPRTALEVVVQVEEFALRLFSIHLSHLPGAQRQAQIGTLRSIAAAVSEEAPLWENDPRISAWSGNRPPPVVPGSTLMLGDFNFEPGGSDYDLMVAPADDGMPGLVDAWSTAGRRSETWQTCVENDGSLSRLDYMFTSPDLGGRITSAAVDQACKASDHFPVTFCIDL